MSTPTEKAESYGIKSNAAVSSFLASEDKAIKKEFLKASYTPLKRFSDIFWSFVFGILFLPSVYNIVSNTTLSNSWIGAIVRRGQPNFCQQSLTDSFVLPTRLLLEQCWLPISSLDSFTGQLIPGELMKRPS